jgi:hypothetical protein
MRQGAEGFIFFTFEKIYDNEISVAPRLFVARSNSETLMS